MGREVRGLDRSPHRLSNISNTFDYSLCGVPLAQQGDAGRREGMMMDGTSIASSMVDVFDSYLARYL
jgi:hypothetical protein